jgi:hypothetical protein
MLVVLLYMLGVSMIVVTALLAYQNRRTPQVEFQSRNDSTLISATPSGSRIGT